MKHELQNTINLLTANPFNAVAVMYKDALGNYQRFYFPTDGKTTPNGTKEQIEKIYGSVNGFFEFLLKNNITNLKITDRKKNGSTFVTTGKEYETTLIPNSDVSPSQTALFETQVTPTVAPTPAPMPAIATPQPTQQSMQGLYGGMNGLSGADFHKVYDHDRLKTELIKAETKVEALTEDKKKLEATIIGLEKDIFRAETLGLKKDGQINTAQQFLETILNSPVGPVLAQKLAPGAATVATGLAGASASHDNFAAFLNTQSQDFVNDLSVIASLMLKNPAFDTAVIQLINQHEPQ